MTAVTARPQPTACDEVEPLLSPCVDGELLEDDRAAVRAHVAGCAPCRERLRALEALKGAVREAGKLVVLPAALEAQVRADVRRVGRRGRIARAGVLGIAVAAAVVATAWIVMPAHAPPPPRLQPRVVEAVLQRHRLELPVDVASPDPRRVQDFLSARVGQKLVVPTLDGWGLEGGRVVDLDEHRGAQLVYAGGYGQRLSVVALPDPDGALARAVLGGRDPFDPFESVTDGLRVRVIAHGGALYGIVGDVDEARLARVSEQLER